MNFTNLLPGMMNWPFTNSPSISSIGLEWDGKYMASVLEIDFGVLVHPRRTSSPN